MLIAKVSVRQSAALWLQFYLYKLIVRANVSIYMSKWAARMFKCNWCFQLLQVQNCAHKTRVLLKHLVLQGFCVLKKIKSSQNIIFHYRRHNLRIPSRCYSGTMPDCWCQALNVAVEEGPSTKQFKSYSLSTFKIHTSCLFVCFFQQEEEFSPISFKWLDVFKIVTKFSWYFLTKNINPTIKIFNHEQILC